EGSRPCGGGVGRGLGGGVKAAGGYPGVRATAYVILVPAGVHPRLVIAAIVAPVFWGQDFFSDGGGGGCAFPDVQQTSRLGGRRCRARVGERANHHPRASVLTYGLTAVAGVVAMGDAVVKLSRAP